MKDSSGASVTMGPRETGVGVVWIIGAGVKVGVIWGDILGSTAKVVVVEVVVVVVVVVLVIVGGEHPSIYVPGAI